MPLADSVIGDAFQPGSADGRIKWFVDDAAGEEDEAAAPFGGRVDDLGIAAVGVHADEQVEFVGHRAVEFSVDVADAGVGRGADALAGGVVFEFVGEGLGCGVDNGRFPATLLKQVSQQPFSAANVGCPAGFKPFHQPAMQQLKAKLLHLAQFAGSWWKQRQGMWIEGGRGCRVLTISGSYLLQALKERLTILLIMFLAHWVIVT